MAAPRADRRPGRGGGGLRPARRGLTGGQRLARGPAGPRSRGVHLHRRTSSASVTAGSRVWVSRYNSFTNGTDDAQSMVVSPSGDTVFVTGWSDGVDTGYDYATVAYNATTGAQLWVSRYKRPPPTAVVWTPRTAAFSVAVSPGGNTVFRHRAKHGVPPRAMTTPRWPTTPRPAPQLWVSRYNGPRRGSMTWPVR